MSLKEAGESKGEGQQIHFRPAKGGETTGIQRNIPGDEVRLLDQEPTKLWPSEHGTVAILHILCWREVPSPRPHQQHPIEYMLPVFEAHEVNAGVGLGELGQHTWN